MYGTPVSFLKAEGSPGAPPKRQPRAAERFRQQGVALLQTGKLPAAITALRQAIRLDVMDAGSHCALGFALLRRGHLAEAAESFVQAIALKDDYAAAHHHLAVALDRQGLDTQAVRAYRRAIQLDPKLRRLHLRLAEIYESVGAVEDAAETYRRAAAEEPGTAAGWICHAKSLMLTGNFPTAEADLRRAIAIEPKSGPAHKVLADVLATQGHFDAAIEMYDAAVRLNSSQADAYLNAVYVRKCTEADRPRLKRMLSMVRGAAMPDRERMYLHFAIGKMLDDLQEYQQAMEHFDAANGIRARRALFDRARFAANFDRLIERFTPALFAAKAEFGLDDETPLLILGMPRSGTTLVEQIISSHPAVAAGGELSFWVKRGGPPEIAEATELSPEAAHELSREYLALLRRFGPAATRVTDKAPFNFHRLGLIHLLLPKARIIHCRRHPVDTCLSMYFLHFTENIEFVARKADLAFAYRQYARAMEHWRAVIPPDRFFEVDYENLIADRQAVTRRLVAFAGLDWHDACLSPERNERTVTTASVWQARQPVYTSSVARWRRYKPWIGEFRELLVERDTAKTEADA